MFSPDGNTLARNSNNTILLWDVNTGSLKKTFKHKEKADGYTDGAISVGFSPDGKYLVSGSYSGKVHLWDIKTGDFKRILNGHTGNVNTLAISPNGKFLATGSTDGTILLFGQVWKE